MDTLVNYVEIQSLLNLREVALSLGESIYMIVTLGMVWNIVQWQETYHVEAIFTVNL